MASDLKISVAGLDHAIRGFQKMGSAAPRYFEAAGDEAGDEILDTVGLRSYPNLTAANLPPTPFYVRGRGTQTASGNRGESERLGTRFYVQADQRQTVIGNTASYAEPVVGFNQAFAMFVIGWKRLYDVAQQKLPRVTAIFQGWMDKLVRDAGLE